MNQAVLITGAHTGTGYAIAEHFAKQGWDVFITSRDGQKAAQAAKTIADTWGVFAQGYESRIGSEEQVIDMFRHIDDTGRTVHTVVLNAADLGFGKDPAKGLDIFDMDVQDFRTVLETNLIWNFTIVRQAALRMRQQHKGSVVFISSNTAHRAIPNRAAYSASKGGINALIKALAVDLGPYGIRCNAVLPGTIKTARWQSMGPKQIVDGSLSPIGDISDFEDIANAVWYFGTDASKNVTGAELLVDGGMSCQLYPPLLNELKRKAQENE